MNNRDRLKMILSRKRKSPCLLTREEGSFLKQFFQLIRNDCTEEKGAKEIYFRYRFELDDRTYTLLEEYLFREKETVLDLNRAIKINYYLDAAEQ